MFSNIKSKNVLLVKWDADLLLTLLKYSVKITLICDESSLPWLDKLGTLKSQIFEIFVVRSFDALEDLIAVGNHFLVNNQKFDLILSYSEYSQYAAALIGEILGDSEVNLNSGRFFRDKRSMKTALKAAGIKCADFQSIPFFSFDDSLKSSQQLSKFPLVLKPANGYGSINTKIIYNIEQFQNYFKNIDKDKLRSYHYCAERFIEGDEFHCDSVWNNGELTSILISKYLTQRINVLEKGREFNGAIILDSNEFSDLYQRIKIILLQIMKLSNLKKGVFHLEFFIQNDGEVCVSEVANRMGGAAICELFEFWFGENLRNIWVNSMMGNSNILNKNYQRQYQTIGWFSLMPSTGGLISFVEDLQKLEDIPGVLHVENNISKGAFADVSFAAASSILFVIGADDPVGFDQKIQDIIKLNPVRVLNE